MKIITQSSASTIKSGSIKEPINTEAELVIKSTELNSKQQSDKPAKGFVRSTHPIDIKLNLDSQIKATVLAIKDKNTYVFLLEDGKTLEMHIDSNKDLKIDSQVIISLDNTQIVDIKPINHAQSITFDNSKPLLTLINNLTSSKIIDNIKADELPLIIQNTKFKDIIKASLPLVGSIDIQTDEKTAIQPQTSEVKLHLNTKTEEPITISTSSSENSYKLNQISNITFKENSIDVVFNAIKNIINSKDNEAILKITDQPNLTLKTVVIENNTKATFNLKSDETILSNIANFKQNPKIPTQIIKADSNNEIESISFSSNDFKEITKEIKSSLIAKLESAPTDKNIEIPVKIRENKIKIPTLSGFSIKTEETTKIPADSLKNITNPKLIINKENSDYIIIKINNKQYPIDIKSVEIPLTGENSLVKNIFKILNNSKIISATDNNLEIKTPEHGQIKINIPNNIFDKENISFELKDNKHLIAKLDEKDPSTKQTTDTQYINKTSELVNSIHNQDSQPVPKMGENFVADTLILLKAFVNSSQQSEDLEKPIDNILTMLNSSVNQQQKPELHLTNINDDNSWRFFTFPYQSEEDTKQGEVLYKKDTNKEGDCITNLAFKVNFSKIGDVTVKIKQKNNYVDINILTSCNLEGKIKDKLINICNLGFKNSDFWGTVHIKKANNLNQPLLKSKKIIYSSQMINIEV